MAGRRVRVHPDEPLAHQDALTGLATAVGGALIVAAGALVVVFGRDDPEGETPL